MRRSATKKPIVIELFYRKYVLLATLKGIKIDKIYIWNQLL